MSKTRVEMAIATRTKLLDAAATLFADHGFDGASVENIASHAGYTHGAVYKHFSDKEDLFLEAMRAYISPRITAIMEELERLDTVEEQIAFLVDSFRNRVTNDRRWILLDNEFWLFAMRRPHQRARVERLYADLLNYYTVFDLPAWRRRAKRIGAKPDDMVAVVSAMMDGLFRHQYAAPTAVNADFVQMSLRALLGMRRSIPDHLTMVEESSSEE